MKTLLYFALGFSIFKAFGQAAPSVSPESAFISYGGSITLTASGCIGTVNWSTGQTGNSISVSPRLSAHFSATCTSGMQTTGSSNIVWVQVGLITDPYSSNIIVSSPLSNGGYRYESNNYILGSSSIEVDAGVLFKSQNYVQLNPGFEAKPGSVFKVAIGNCTELLTRELITGREFPWEITWGPDNYIWMTERNGKISRVDPQTGIAQTLIIIPAVYSIGESGLLGMALHPDFNNNPYV